MPISPAENKKKYPASKYSILLLISLRSSNKNTSGMMRYLCSTNKDGKRNKNRKGNIKKVFS